MNNINEIYYEAQDGAVKVVVDCDAHFFTDGSGRYGAPSGCAVKILGWDTLLDPQGYASELNVNIDTRTFTTKDAMICTDKGFLKALKNHLVDDCAVPNKLINELDYAEIDRQITGRVVFNCPGELDTWFRQQLLEQLVNPVVLSNSQKF